jgi:hypothetical protein
MPAAQAARKVDAQRALSKSALIIKPSRTNPIPQAILQDPGTMQRTPTQLRSKHIATHAVNTRTLRRSANDNFELQRPDGYAHLAEVDDIAGDQSLTPLQLVSYVGAVGAGGS